MAEQRVSLVLSVTGQQQFEKAARSIGKVEQAANKISPTGGKVNNALRGLGSAARGAIPGVSGLGAALSAALGPIAAVTSAAALVSKALSTAFERGAAEQKLRNFTDSTEEYNAALAVAADTASKFGMSQTEATGALADTYSRLKGLGFGLKETSEIYNGFQSIVLQSGTSAEDAAGAFLQLSQALGSGKLQGDELRAILERMPQLAQAIAKSMGVSAAEIRKMGQEGKITSEVIYKALSEAGGAADGFGSKLNEQQQAMKALGAAADQAFALIGKALSPVVVAAAEGFAWVVKELTDIWEYLAANVFPKVVEAVQPVVKAIQEAFKDVDWEAIGKAIKLYIIGYFEALVFVVQNVSKGIAFVINLFKQLADSPAFKALLWPLQKAVELLGGVKDPVKEWKNEQTKVTEESAKTAKNFSSMPEKLEDAKGKAKELKQEQQAVTKAMQEGSAALDRQFQAMESLAGLSFNLGQERLKTEMALNDVLLQQAQRQLDGAKNAEEKEQAAKRIYDLTIQQAELELQSTKAAIAESVRKVEAQRDLLVLKAKEIEAEVALARAKGIATDEHENAVALANEAVGLAQQQLEMQRMIAGEQYDQADALFKGKEAAAQAAYEQNKVWENTKGAASAANEFANNMSKAAGQAERAANAVARANSYASTANSSTIGGQAGVTNEGQVAGWKAAGLAKKVDGEWVFDMDKYQKLSFSQAQRAAREMDNAEKDYMKANPIKEYASGGYIRKGEVGIVGENGPELIEGPAMVTSNPRLKAAMAGGSGDRGMGGAVQITYNGETIDFDGRKYIRREDVGNMINAAVKGVQRQMAGNPRYRLEAGMA